MSELGFLDLARQRILVFDGGMGTLLQEMAISENLPLPRCPEEWVLTHPDLVRRAHREYLEAGAEVVETNTLGAAPHVLCAFGLAERALLINETAARLARQEADSFPGPVGRKERFVAGSMGPGSLLPSLGQTSFAELAESYRVQAIGLLTGGVDALLVETVQDLLQAKAALWAIEEAFRHLGRRVPVLAQVTVDRRGRTLTGSDIPTILAALEPWPLAAIGLNCGEGPEALAEAVGTLAEGSSKLVSLQPNAGLPRLVGERTVYDLSPENFATGMTSLCRSPGLNLVGGCCGTTPAHIRAMAHAVAGIPPRVPQAERLAALASLYQAQPIAVQPRPLLAGERTNAAGSRLFRTAVTKEHWEEAAQLGLAQEREGAHLLDLSAATAERDEAADLGRLASLFNRQAHLPLMLDSTDPAATEEGLRAVAGRAVINSAHLEDGGGKARQVIELARRYGAALVLLTIDEQGMAQTSRRKLEVADRLYRLALEGGLKPQDLFFDPLTFTLASGDTSLCAAGRETLAALQMLKERFPHSFTLLGISNISYGLPAPARRVLNSVFLARAVERGLDAAILHAGQILPLHRLAAEEVRLADDLLFDRRSPGSDPLSALLTYFREGAIEETIEMTPPPPTLAIRLRQAVLEGDGRDLTELLQGLLVQLPAMKIIEEQLTPAMEEVGRLFETGGLLLPFVLRSAEVMRSALAILQSYLPAGGGRSEGCVVLATVRGDVHDIGKNLVGMILAGYGFRVIDLGTRQPAEAILEAVRQYRPLAVGLSSLLMESARACRAYLEIFRRAGVSLPVLLGGAAMTRSLAEGELQALYPGPVRYAADAMEGLRILQRIQQEGPGLREEEPAFAKAGGLPLSVPLGQELAPSRFWASAKKIPRPRDLFTPTLEEFLPFLDRRTLYRQRWQWVSLKGGGAGGAQVEEAQRERAARALDRLLAMGKAGGLWEPRVLSKPFKVRVEEADLVVLHPRSERSQLRFCFAPRHLAPRTWEHLAQGLGEIVLQVVSLGQPASDEGEQLSRQGQVVEAFLWHGLCSELAEALAKWNEHRIKVQYGWQRSRRWSPGFPVWPDLAEQRKVFRLLRPWRIGLRLTESWQMDPQYATSAIVFPIAGKEKER